MSDLIAKLPDTIKIGTCSWKYDSWKGRVYSDEVNGNYLSEYSRVYNTVEIDQWFWSLFGDKIVLPRPDVVEEYSSSVPEYFRFSIKVPNAITLTHQYQKGKKRTLETNPHFLSNQLFDDFLKLLGPMSGQIETFIFQFEYLNRQKMPNQGAFQQRLRKFFNHCPKEYRYAVEIRNPDFLNANYFGFLQSLNLAHVFLQGYWMPSIFKIYGQFKSSIKAFTLIRLLGPDRKKIEKITGKKWHTIVDPKDDELHQLTSMVEDLMARQVRIGINVNNHYEGCAPLTIDRFVDMLFKDRLT